MTIGVYGSSASIAGTGVQGYGGAYGVVAKGATGVKAIGTAGIGVAAYGDTEAIRARRSASNGYAIHAMGRFKSTWRTFLGTPNTAPNDADLNKSSLSFYLDQATNTLKVRVKYADGTLKTGLIALT